MASGLTHEQMRAAIKILDEQPVPTTNRGVYTPDGLFWIDENGESTKGKEVKHENR